MRCLVLIALCVVAALGAPSADRDDELLLQDARRRLHRLTLQLDESSDENRKDRPKKNRQSHRQLPKSSDRDEESNQEQQQLGDNDLTLQRYHQYQQQYLQRSQQLQQQSQQYQQSRSQQQSQQYQQSRSQQQQNQELEEQLEQQYSQTANKGKSLPQQLQRYLLQQQVQSEDRDDSNDREEDSNSRDNRLQLHNQYLHHSRPSADNAVERLYRNYLDSQREAYAESSSLGSVKLFYTPPKHRGFNLDGSKQDLGYLTLKYVQPITSLQQLRQVDNLRKILQRNQQNQLLRERLDQQQQDREDDDTDDDDENSQ